MATGSEESIVVSISQMIDLAIGTPEVGTVDFNMLQTVLHCIAQQLHILNKNVEVRPGGITLPIPPSKENLQTVVVTEFFVDPEKSAKTAQAPPPPEDNTILVVERVKKTDTPTRGTTAAPTAPPSSTSPPVSSVSAPAGAKAQDGGGAQGAGQTAAVAQSGAPVQAATAAPSGGLAAATPAAGPVSTAALAPSAAGSVSATAPATAQGQRTAAQQPTQAARPSVVAPQAQPQTGQLSQVGRPSVAGPVAISSSDRLALVTVSKFNVLENMVEDLKNRVYGSMPKNEEILEEVRSQTNLKAITDMWTSLNVSSRLEAAEAGIGKLSSLVQDLISETAALQGAAQASQARPAAVAPAAPAAAPAQAPAPAVSTPGKGPAASSTTGPGTMSTTGPATVPTTGPTPAAPAQAVIPAPAAAGAAQTPGATSGPQAPDPQLIGPEPATKEELAYLQAHLARLRSDLDQLSHTFYTTMEEMHSSLGIAPPAPPPPPPPPPAPPLPASELTEVLPPRPSSFPPSQDRRGSKRFSLITAGLVDRVNDIDRRLKECCEQIHKNDGVVSDQLNSFQDQLEQVLKQVAGLTELSTGGALSPDLVKDLQGLMHLFQTVQEMQDQLQKVHETALQLAAEKEDRQHHMNALLEQIELLKNIKLDREDMIEAMAEKADLRMLARKVSHDQFEMACDDLSRGLEHALGKLNMQEALWQQALDDIQREIETKLDKMELSPVKEFFNSKLKQLQENLKQMASLRREAEAAGTKRKLLRDVNCISCDANAVMAMEAGSTMPVAKPLPATLSMKPYLTYELDAIRKTQASNLPQRNMHDWENIDKQMGPKQPQKVRSETDKHLCNRYCGGSHTVTTPAQRVARLGHFIKQWGPDVLPLSSGLATGDDGRMYRVCPVEGANVGPGGAVDATCTPKPPRKSEVKPPPKPIISAECRCLEDQQTPK